MSNTGPIATATAPLSALNLFPVFPTAEQYKAATGTDAQPFDDTLPIKTWADPDGEAGQISTYLELLPGTPGPGGMVPYKYKDFYMDGGLAAKLNLPTERNLTMLQNHAKWPMPVRALAVGESLREGGMLGMGGTLLVNDALYGQSQKAAVAASGDFTADDRALLQAIAGKLGVGGS